MSKQLTYEEAKYLGLLRKLRIEDCDGKYRGSALYVLKFEQGVKIGIAKNLVNRLKYYYTPWSRPIIDTCFFKTLTPSTMELEIKRKYAHITEEGHTEYFKEDVFLEILQHIVKSPFYSLYGDYSKAAYQNSAAARAEELLDKAEKKIFEITANMQALLRQLN